MKQTTYMIRRTDADAMSTKVLALVKARAQSNFGCDSTEAVASFSVGYLSSLLAQVASQSKQSMDELASVVRFLEKQ